MGGTFASFNGALSALRYNQVVMDNANSNVANASTAGYTRRRVLGEALGPSAAPAMWSRSQDTTGGVRVAGLQRMSDAFLDARARFEHGNQAYLDTRKVTLERIETGVGEPGPNGVAAALAKFRSGLHDLANNPGSDAARSQVLSRAGSLADAIRVQSRNVAVEESDQRSRLVASVDQVNTLASDLAATNESIAAARLSGTDAGTLLDQRDLLSLRLSELTGAKGTVRPDGGMDVSLNGVPLVTGNDAARLTIATGVTPGGDADGAPVTFSVVSSSGTVTAVPAGMRGEIGSTADLLTTTLPAYRAGLGVVAKTLADEMNAQHAAGFDRAGNPGQPLFSYDPADVAGSLKVALTDPARVAASSRPGGVLDGGNATAMAGAITIEDDYQRLVTGLGSEVASVRRLALNQQALTAQVDASREQLGGVNLDEEMVTMVSAQRAYEAAARLMTTVDSVLDTLINRTGLVR